MERRLSREQPVEPELAEKARRQVGRLSRLVEDLLDVSRLESMRMELTRELLSVDDLVAEVLDDFRGTAGNHELVLERPRERLEVQGDRARLEQVMINLVQNAIKYSPTGGKVVVAVERASSDVRISVKDPGIGIPLEEQGRLFQRFFRARNVTTRHYGGLGIGLFVSREIVQRHGGRFEVQSAPGQGSTFTFFLPLYRSGAREAAG
jgi:signal transduction histidine kinase